MPFVTTTETGASIQGPTATLLYDDWYPALRTDKLRRGKLATAMLLDIPLVLGRRNDGRVFAMRDSCPHRGIPLSYGWFDGDHVTCRYHGWEFEPCGGQCALIPSLSTNDRLDATRIYATAYPCEERDGHAWVYIPAAGTGRKAETTSRRPVPELAKFGPRYRTAHLAADGPGSRTVCSPGLVVAFARQHSPEDETLRAYPGGLPHERARTQRQLRALQAARRL